jgi:hypothetical protein
MGSVALKMNIAMCFSEAPDSRVSQDKMRANMTDVVAKGCQIIRFCAILCKKYIDQKEE